MEKYESTSEFRDMSTVKFCEEHLGIKLRLYQKLYLQMFDKYLKFEKKHMPNKYMFRIMRYK